MKQIFILCVLVIAVKGQTSSWMPIVGPLLSTYPCKDNDDIMVWFEPGLQPRENNRYYVYVNKAFPKDGKIKIMFDSQVNITFAMRTDKNEYTRLSLADGDMFSLHFFMPHMGLGFVVKGTEPSVTPYMLSFTVDGVENCKQPSVGFLQPYAAKSTANDLMACGRRMLDQAELILHPNGPASTKPGDWPWHVAIYKLDKTTTKYICGGTLISKNFVLTAAHCATVRGTRVRSESLSVVLGKFRLTGHEKESEQKEVLDIIIHRAYNYLRLRNDIALLKLKTDVTFNEFIRPACLWQSNDKRNMPTGELLGTVVGWGFDHTDKLSEILQRATMPMVSEATCLKSNALFYSHALNDYNFCAGYRNGTSPCNGDSGSAFQVFIPDEIQIGGNATSGTWHVKGIVSNTLSRDDAAICDPNQYVIYTDVEKYTDWINQHLGA